MTHDEMERSMVFVLDSQATLTAKLEKLTDDVAEMKVQAGLDRAEMRDAINAMLLIAERMERNVIGLTQAQKGTSQRVGRLEKRVTKLEQSDQPD